MLTDEQKAMRRNGIGGSEIGAVAGLNPWSGPHDVWSRKVGLVDDAPPTGAMEWGTYIEPAIVALWRARTGVKVRCAGRHQRTLVHPHHPICIATPDGLVDPVSTLEVKSYGWRVAHHWGEPMTDAIPDYYLAQVTWAMAAAGRTTAIVVAEHERQVDEYRVGFDRDLFGALLEVAERFWRDHVLTRTPPPVDHSDRCREFLERWYPRPMHDKLMAPTTPEATDLVAELRDAEAAVKEAEARRSGARNRLMDMIGEYYGINTDAGKVIWYSVKGRLSYDGKGLVALARRLGATDDQIAELTRQGDDYRVFRSL